MKPKLLKQRTEEEQAETAARSNSIRNKLNGRRMHNAIPWREGKLVDCINVRIISLVSISLSLSWIFSAIESAGLCVFLSVLVVVCLYLFSLSYYLLFLLFRFPFSCLVETLDFINVHTNLLGYTGSVR